MAKSSKVRGLLVNLYIYKAFAKPSVKSSDVKQDLYVALEKKKYIYNCMQRSFQNRISFHLLAPKSHGYSKSVIRGVKKWTIIVIMKISIFSIWALDFFM